MRISSDAAMVVVCGRTAIAQLARRPVVLVVGGRYCVELGERSSLHMHSIHGRIGYGPHQRFCVLFCPASPWPWPHKSFCPSAYVNRCGDSLQDGMFR